MRIEEEIKQSKFKSDQHRMIINLIFTANWFNAIHARALKPFGISSQQYNILRILRGQHPEPVNLITIQERMLDKNSNASRLIDKLMAKKLVVRKDSRTDRRKIEILITPKGLEFLEEADKISAEVEKKLDNITRMEANRVNSVLEKLRESD